MRAPDLSRIPEPYRARVEREMMIAAQDAWPVRDGCPAPLNDADARSIANAAGLAELARWLKVADEADAAAEAARRATGLATTAPHAGAQAAEQARAEVWRAAMARIDGQVTIDLPTGDEIQLDGLDWRIPKIGPPLFVTEPIVPLVLDALLRYLADKPAETLRVIAGLLKTLPVGATPVVNLGSRAPAGYALVAGLPGASCGETRADDGGRLSYAYAEIEGVEFSARYRP